MAEETPDFLTPDDDGYEAYRQHWLDGKRPRLIARDNWIWFAKIEGAIDYPVFIPLPRSRSWRNSPYGPDDTKVYDF